MVGIAQWTIDARNVPVLAEFWAQALGYRAEVGDDGFARLYPPEDAPAGSPTVWLQPTDDPKTSKNRVHPDLPPGPDGQQSEVDRLLGLGARHVDVGQSDSESFVVLADPEGNEFCVLDGERRRTAG
jgi:hypothetical protein